MTRIKRTRRAKRTKRHAPRTKKLKRQRVGGGMFEVWIECRSLNNYINNYINKSKKILYEEENYKNMIKTDLDTLLNEYNTTNYDKIKDYFTKELNTITRHDKWTKIENNLKEEEKKLVGEKSLYADYGLHYYPMRLTDRNDLRSDLKKKIKNATEKFEKLNAIFQKKIYYDVIIELLEEKINPKEQVVDEGPGAIDSANEDSYAALVQANLDTDVTFGDFTGHG